MANYTLPNFGQLDTSNLEEYYDVDINLNGHEIQIDLNFENQTIHAKRLDTVKKFIENISDFDKKNKKYIDQDYANEDCDTIKTYVEHHIAEIDKEELAEVVDPGHQSLSTEEQLVKALRLVRLGLYPDSEDQFAIFDYSIGQELTQYLVVINTDQNGKLDYMTMES